MIAKIVAYGLTACFFLLITAGLVFAGMAAQKNLAAFSTNMFGATAVVASTIGIVIGSFASVLGRVMFTIGRACAFTNTLSEIAFTNGSCGKEFKWKQTIGAVFGTVQCGLFIGFSQSSDNDIVKGFAAASAGAREASGEITAMIKSVETPEQAQKKAQLKHERTLATVGLFRAPRARAVNQGSMAPVVNSALS